MITYTVRADIINGLGGNGSVNVYGGNDVIDGGDGHDVIHGGYGDDISKADLIMISYHMVEIDAWNGNQWV